MRFATMIALTIVSLVIFMILYKYFIKINTSIVPSFNGNRSASSPYCIPDDGTARTHLCESTYTMDINIQELSYKKPSHIISVCEKLDPKKTTSNSNFGSTACVSFKKEHIPTWGEDHKLAVLIDKDINNLHIHSKHLDNPKVIKNIPLGEFINLSFVFKPTYMEVYINGLLADTYILQKQPPASEPLHIYATQLGGFNGYIKNTQYIPKALNSSEIPSVFDSKYSLNNIFTTIVNYPSKLFHKYDNSSCI